MILGFIFLLGGAAMIVLALRWLRAATDPGGPGAAVLHLVVAPPPGQNEPRVTLRRGDGIVLGPYRASWDPPKGMEGVPAPVSGSGRFQVVGAVDLRAEDALGTGDPRLAKLLRDGLGASALVLAPLDGDRPLLLHGGPRGRRGSLAGIGMEQVQLDALIDTLGDASGLRVEVQRRRVQRMGWGGAQGQRQRSRQ